MDVSRFLFLIDIYMEMNKLNEYYVGNPDVIYDTYDYSFRLNWRKGGTSFGYFPISFDGGYEFMTSNESHYVIAEDDSAERILGKARHHISDDDFYRIVDQCYMKAYAKGRYWENEKMIAFWSLPTSELLSKVVSELGIEPDEYTIITQRLGEDGDGFNLTVSEYLQVGYKRGDDGSDNINHPWDINDDVKRALETYNNVDNGASFSRQKERNGWPFMAMRNHMIYQEEKEPKNTINESNMKNKIMNEEFSNYISIMSEALENNDFKAYEYVKDMLDEAIEDKKHEAELMKEMNTYNFGILNHIFEAELPTLIKSNKKAVREVIKTIKEDKNLLGQFNFYHVIKEQYKGGVTSKVDERTALETIAKIVCEDIDVNTVKESNKKLRKVMIENHIVPSDFVDDENRALYESGNIILTKKKTTANVMPLIESYDAVCQYMKVHKDDDAKSSVDVGKLVREFEERLKTNLNESEISFVKQITDFKSPIAEQRKEKLFNKFKNECIEKVNKMLSEDSANINLLDLKKQLEEQKFNNETIVKDIAKLLEIRDILMDD